MRHDVLHALVLAVGASIMLGELVHEVNQRQGDLRSFLVSSPSRSRPKTIQAGIKGPSTIGNSTMAGRSTYS